MTLIEQISLGISAVATLVAAIQTARLGMLHRVALRVADRATQYRQALSYIATGATFPHDHRFALAILDGNDIAIRHGFRAFEDFRTAGIEEMEDDDA